jgi:hypothetical protein
MISNQHGKNPEAKMMTTTKHIEVVQMVFDKRWNPTWHPSDDILHFAH